MAVIVNRNVVCDICRNLRRAVKPYRLSQDGQPLKLYLLCREHAAPFESILQKKVGTLVTDGRMAPRAKVFTMDELYPKDKKTTH